MIILRISPYFKYEIYSAVSFINEFQYMLKLLYF